MNKNSKSYNHPILPLNLSLLAGLYFYPPTANEEGDLSLTNKFELVEINGGQPARWGRPNAEYLYDNVYLLMEHPRLNDALRKKVTFVNSFLATKSDQSRTALQDCMNNIIEIMLDILKFTHRQYWYITKNNTGVMLDGVNTDDPIRSQYDFNQCLNEAIDVMKDKLDLLNIITDIQNPYAISASQIDRQVKDNIKQAEKALGKRETDAMDKPKKIAKKPKK